MPTLLMDATALSPKPKGVGRYTRHILMAACEKLPSDWSIVLLVSEDLTGLYSFDARVRTVDVAWANDLLRGVLALPALCLKERPSAVLIPMDTPVWVPGVPYAVVTHDIPQLIEGAESGAASGYRRVVNALKDRVRVAALRAADHLFCNSQFTQAESIRRYGIDPGRTSIAYCGVDERFYAPPDKAAAAYWPELAAWRGYVLTFATGDTRESFHLSAAAWAAARGDLDGVGLVIGGIRPGADYVEALKAEFRRHGLREGADVLFIPFLGVGEFDALSALYHDADLYLELSGHEGFGMQLAEALACGASCVSSGRGALQEVGAGYPLELAALDVPSIAAALRESYATGFHQRDNAEQVAMTRRYDWRATSSAIVETIMALAVRGGAP